MYIEALPDLPFGDWVRTCVSVSFQPSETQPAGGSALEAILGLGRAVPNLAVSMRIHYEPGQPLSRTFIFLGPASSEEALRRFVARFTRLELVAGQVGGLAASPEHLDEMLGQFPRWRSRVVAVPEGNGDPWYVPEFHLLPSLGQLLWSASSQGTALSYQVNFWPWVQSIDSLRRCSYNLLKATRVVGIPDDLLAMQRRVESRVRGAEYLAEEFVGVSSRDSARTIGGELTGLFSQALGALRFPRVDFPFSEFGFEDAIDSGFHTSATEGAAPPQAWVEACPFGQITESAAWKPDSWMDLAVPQPAPVPSQTEPSIPWPAAPEPRAGDYAFISYSRADQIRVSVLLRAMERDGVGYWYDQQIPGAADWHEMLEDRISRCGFLVLMLSPMAVASRYVRREVAYADSLNKPILTVRLEPAELTGGLAMRLGQSQMIDGDPLRFSGALNAAVAFLRSGTLRAGA